MEFMRDDLEKFNNATYRHVCQFRSCQTTREYTIIVIWQGDSEVPRIQIVI